MQPHGKSFAWLRVHLTYTDRPLDRSATKVL